MQEFLYSDLKRCAETLRKQNRFEEAAKWYLRLLHEYPDQCDVWVYWGAATSFVKLKRYREAIMVCTTAQKIYPGNIYIYNVCSWAVFHAIIKKLNVHSLHKIYKAAKFIFKYCPDISPANPRMPTLLEVMKYVDQQQIAYPEFLVQAAESVDIKLLSDRPTSFKSHNNVLSIASELEQYLSCMIDLYFDQKKWDACVEYCDKALTSITSPHYNNRIWWTRTKALALVEMNEDDTAIRLLSDILQQKKEWFLFGDLAHVYYKIEQYGKSLDLALEAVLSNGTPKMKVNLYLLLAKCFEKNEIYAPIPDTLALAVSIRKHNQWNVPPALLKISLRWQVFDVAPDDSKGLLKRCLPIWRRLWSERQQWAFGTISFLFEHGNAGFILRDTSRQSYYFKTEDFKGPLSKLKANTPVRFLLKEGFDKKKNIPTTVAFHIIPLSATPSTGVDPITTN